MRIDLRKGESVLYLLMPIVLFMILIFLMMMIAVSSSQYKIFFSHIYLARVSRLMPKSFGFCASARLATEND